MYVDDIQLFFQKFQSFKIEDINFMSPVLKMMREMRQLKN